MISFCRDKDLRCQGVSVFRGTGEQIVPAVKPLPKHDEPDPGRTTKIANYLFQGPVSKICLKPL